MSVETIRGEEYVFRVEQTGWAKGRGTVDGVKGYSYEAETERLDYFLSDMRYDFEKFMFPEKSRHQLSVEKFMNKTPNQKIPEKVRLLTPEERVFRAKLIWEEVVKELINDGLEVMIHVNGAWIDWSSLNLTPRGVPMDIVALADGCFDSAYVITGTLSLCGLPDSGQDLVNENNLKKFGPGHRVDEHGKLIKPPDHVPPDIKAWIKRVALKDGVELKELGLNEET